MADHYDMTIIPARVRSPRDKSAVEGSVKTLTTAIIGHLRDRTFFSFKEINDAILKELDVYKNVLGKFEKSGVESVTPGKYRLSLKTVFGIANYDFEIVK